MAKDDLSSFIMLTCQADSETGVTGKHHTLQVILDVVKAHMAWAVPVFTAC